MTNPAPRELALVEAALKAAAEKCDELEQVATTMPASASQPAEQSEDDRERFEAWTRTKRDGWEPISPFDAWQAAKRDALTQAPQEQVEPTDAPSSFHNWAMEAIGTVALHDGNSAKELAAKYRIQQQRFWASANKIVKISARQESLLPCECIY